jgi:uncharacterized protein
MRRKDREIADDNEIREIIDKAQICRIALSDGEFPYIVPMNFGVEWNNPIKLYFHCANAGRKLEIIRKNNNVCFQADIYAELILNDIACKCTINYHSVIAFGTIQIITNPIEKIKGLNILMSHYSSAEKFNYEDKIFEMTTVLEMTVNKISGKKKMIKSF